jgi:hypothetical protein
MILMGKAQGNSSAEAVVVAVMVKLSFRARSNARVSLYAAHRGALQHVNDLDRAGLRTIPLARSILVDEIAR